MARDSGVPRRAVLAAALDIVATDGFGALTIAELAARSGVSNGSIYHHFGNRGGVVHELYRESFELCIATLIPALDARPAAEVIPDLVRRYLTWIVDNPARARFIYAAATTADALETDLAQSKAAVLAPIGSWFARRVAAGEVRPTPQWALDPIVMGPAHECARRHLAAPDQFPLGAMREEAARAAWAVVRP